MTIHNQAYLENPFCLAFEQTKAELHEKWEARKPGDKKAETALRKEWDEEMAQALSSLKSALADQGLMIDEGFSDRSEWFENLVPINRLAGARGIENWGPPSVSQAHDGARP